MRIILSALASIALLAQAPTPLRINQGGGLSGELRQQEPRSGGTNWFTIGVPELTGDLSLKWPASLPATEGKCMGVSVAGAMAVDRTCEKLVADYDWSRSLGALAAPGTVTVTFANGQCPAAASDAQYVARIYESLVPTTYSLHVAGAGTCTRGGSGTLIFSAVGGTYTTAIITSANGGWTEAMFSVADSNYVHLRAGIGNYHVYSSILSEDRAPQVQCDRGATLVPRVDNLKVFDIASPSSIKIDGCSISNSTYLHTGVTGVYLNNPDGSTFGGRISRMEMQYLENGIHAVTGYLTDILDNRITQADNAAIWLENIDTGDAGIGLVAGNNLSCVTTCAHGLLWNSPGALQFKNNGLNGFTEQVTLDPHFGYVSTADSGADTVITWQSGNRFRSTMVGSNIQIGATGGCTLDAWTSSTVMRCNGQNLGTLTNQRYYVGGTGQVQVIGNLLDGGANTTHGVRWLGEIFLFNAQIEQNFFANYTVVGAKGISIEGSGHRLLQIKNNNIQAAALASTIGIDIQAGDEMHVANNQISGVATGINVAGSALHLQVENNRFTGNATTPVASAASTAKIREAGPFTYAQLAALTAENGSQITCSNCKATSTASAVCATGGTGAEAHRINGAWQCFDGTSVNLWSESGGNVYRPTGRVGINIAAPLQPLDVFGTSASPATSGTTQNGILRITGNATNALDMGAYASAPYAAWLQSGNVTDLSTYAPLYLNPLGGLVHVGPGGIGRYTSAALPLVTDNVIRWNVTAAGMIAPQVDDTYDLCLTGTRCRGVYAKFGEFYKSGSTYSSDYLTTRKYNFLDLAGGSGSWDAFAAGSMAATSQWTLRDNAGSRAFQITRAIAGSPLNNIGTFGNLIPSKRAIADGDAVNDSVFPNLGATGSEWAEAHVGALYATGAADITGNLSAAIINATGSPAYRVAGTTVINASRAATFTGLTIATGASTGYVWTDTGSGVGAWAAAAAVTAPLTLSLAASGYAEPLIISNPSHGVYGSCVVMQASDTSATIYKVGRICSRFDSASFTDELVTLQTTTNGSTGWSVAQSWKNLESTFYGNLLPSGTVSLGAGGNDFNRLWVGGVETTSFSRPQVDLGATNGTSTKRWSATYTGDFAATGLAVIGTLSPTVRLGQTLSLDYSANYAGMAVNTWSTTDGEGSVIDFNKSGSATIGAHATVNSGETLGFFVFRGSDGAAFQRGAEVDGEVDAAVSSGIVPGRLRFRTANTSGTMTERMRIDSAGLVSITGTASVSGLLTASAGLTVAGTITFPTGTTGHCWINSGSGVGGWAACSGGSAAPFIDSTAIIKGSADATKLLAIEVDGFTTGTTNTLTPQNASYTIAGTNIAQTFSGANTFSVGQTFAGGFQIQASLSTNSSSSYDFGSSSDRLRRLFAEGVTVYGSSFVQSGATMNFQAGATVNYNGSAGYTGTITIRNSAGTGTCTLTVNFGGITATTC